MSCVLSGSPACAKSLPTVNRLNTHSHTKSFVVFLVEINVANDCRLGGGVSEMVLKTSKTALHGDTPVSSGGSEHS